MIGASLRGLARPGSQAAINNHGQPHHSLKSRDWLKSQDCRSSGQPDPGASTLGPSRLTPDLFFIGCLETHNRHPRKTSRHLMTHSNSQSKGLEIRLQKSILGDVAGVSDWGSATAQFTMTATVVDAVRAPLEPVTVTM